MPLDELVAFMGELYELDFDADETLDLYGLYPPVAKAVPLTSADALPETYPFFNNSSD